MARWMRGEASDPTVWRRVQAAGRRVQASDTKRVSAKLGLGPCQMRVSLDGVRAWVRRGLEGGEARLRVRGGRAHGRGRPITAAASESRWRADAGSEGLSANVCLVSG